MGNENKKVILAVDDDQELQGVLPLLLRKEGEVIGATSIGKALEVLSDKPVDLAIVDLHLEGEEKDGRFILEQLSKNHPNVPVIVLSGDTLTSRIVDATRFNLVDFIPKDQDFHNALTRSVQKGLSLMEKSLKEADIPIFETRSPAMRLILEEIGRVLKNDSQSPILITGETGTGKEIMAKHIAHILKKTMVTANMAAIPKEIAEAELFGANEGAYTGATKSREGLIQKANNGICFLDEVGDCPLIIQASLLRTIQENEVRSVGSSHTKKLNVRFLAATNRNLGQMVTEKTFREDLLERLCTFPVRLLPLRQRPEDILFYAEKFLKFYSPDKPFFISASGETALLNYEWPRNVRELSNAVKRIIALSSKTTIDDEAVLKAIGSGEISTRNIAISSNRIPASEEIVNTLRRMDGNRTQAAAFFGVHKVTFLRWIKALGIENKVPAKIGRPRELPERALVAPIA